MVYLKCSCCGDVIDDWRIWDKKVYCDECVDIDKKSKKRKEKKDEK